MARQWTSGASGGGRCRTSSANTPSRSNAPYAGWETVEEAAAFPWPNPDWFDYEALPAICARYPELAIAAGSFGVQDFINGVAFGRGVEQVLIDIAVEDPVYLYIVERRHRFYMEYIERILRAAAGGSIWSCAATTLGRSALR